MMDFKRFLYLFLTLSFIISLVSLSSGCDNKSDKEKDDIAGRLEEKETPATALFSFSDVELTGGDRFRIIPTFSPYTDITYDQIEYIVVKGDNVVSVDGYYLTAKAAGDALVLAEYVNDRSVYSTFSVKVDMKGELFKISKYVYASKKGGVYSNAFSLTLKPSSDSYKIYYTLDCSVPVRESKPYSVPLSISDKTLSGTYPLTSSVLSEPIDGAGQGKTVSDDYLNNIERKGVYPKVGCGTVVTYSVYDGDALLETSSVTYIIKNNAEDYFTIPVVCLSMPYENWFDDQEGIYNIVYHDLKSRANLEYYDPVSGESFKVNTSIKVGGGWSRGYPKRTLNLNFKKDESGSRNAPSNTAFFGEVTMDGDSGALLSEISRLRLHNSGNTYESGSMFGDAFFQEISKETNCATTSYRPCLVYLNGEYWGYYGLREHYGDTFFENNYGVDSDDVVVATLTGNVWQISEGDQTEAKKMIEEMRSYYKKRDFTKDTAYNSFIDKYIDKDSFLDALILEAFAHNWDYVANNNNFRIWRTTKVKEGVPYYDGKWRVCLHDLDFALQHNTGNYLVPKEYTSTKSNDYSYDKYPLFNKLLSNPSFREDLVNRVKELFSTVLTPEKTTAILDRMTKEFEPFFEDNAKRWGIGYTKDAWLEYINSLRARLTSRAEYFTATTLAMYGSFEDDGSTLVTVDNTGSDSSDNNSESFDLNSRYFDLEFYMNNEEYSKPDARAFIRFASGDKYFKIYWGAGIYSSQWMSGSVAEGGANVDIDYINVGTHKININYKNGTVVLTVDDYFTKTFKLTSDFIKVDSFSFGSMQCRVSCNRIKAVKHNGLGNNEEIIF